MTSYSPVFFSYSYLVTLIIFFVKSINTRYKTDRQIQLQFFFLYIRYFEVRIINYELKVTKNSTDSNTKNSKGS